MVGHSSGFWGQQDKGNDMRTIRRFSLVAVPLLVLSVASVAQAAIVTWDGEAAVGPWNWIDGVNWAGDVAPMANDELVFPGTATNRGTTNNFPANTQFNGITISANSYVLAGAAINLGGNVAFTAGGSNVGTVSLSAALLQDTTYNVAATTSNGRLEWSGGISGNFGITKTGTGLMRMTGTAKSYTGDTNINEGTMDVAASDNLPFGAGRGNVNVALGATLLQINQINLNINGLNGAGAFSETSSNSRTLTVGNGGASGSFSGTVSMSGGGGNQLIKTGSGTQTFSSTATIAGSSTVNGGTLVVNGNWSGVTGGVNANTGGTLKGTGTIGGTTTIANATTVGTLAPGTSVGTMNLTNLVINANGVLAFELNGANQTIGGTTNDLLLLTGNLTLNGTLNVTETVANSFLSATGGNQWRSSPTPGRSPTMSWTSAPCPRSRPAWRIKSARPSLDK